MGGGGVGKSVLTAELLHRAFERVVAWHFCRHDNPQQSSPAALLRSLAAMLCARLLGYKEALGEVSAELLTSTDPKELFAALFTAPLQKVKSPDVPRLIIIDALDELPKQGQKALLDVIATQLSTLPKWLRLFVTSREEPQIKTALARFEPKELRADEAKNRADVEVCWITHCDMRGLLAHP
jgi:ATP/maltotriose-dependent transcriptional regulator MalT